MTKARTLADNFAADINGITAGTGITGGGTSGTVTITNDMATTIAAKGDLVAGTANDAYAALTVGANNTVLTADSSTATGLKWAAVAAGGKVLQVVTATYSTETVVSSTTYTDTGLTATITPSATNSKIYVLVSQAFYANASSAQNVGCRIRLLRGSSEIHAPSQTANGAGGVASATVVTGFSMLQYLDSPNTTSATTYKTQGAVNQTANSGSVSFQLSGNVSTMTLFEIGA